MTKKSLYQVLGVSCNASAEDIRKAYRALALRLHPDKNPGDASAGEAFREVSIAYSTLSDVGKRRAYDLTGDADGNAQAYGHGTGAGTGVHRTGPVDPMEIFEDLFDLSSLFGNIKFATENTRSFFTSNTDTNTKSKPSTRCYSSKDATRTSRQSSPTEVKVPVSLTDVKRGCVKSINVETMEECDACEGTGIGSERERYVSCHRCHGACSIMTPVAPGISIQMKCEYCNGSGMVMNDDARVTESNACKACGGIGEKVTKRTLSVKLPCGVKDHHVHEMKNEGVLLRIMYDEDARACKNIDTVTGDVHLETGITLEEVMVGFDRVICLIDTCVRVQSKGYMDPSKPLIVRSAGIPTQRTIRERKQQKKNKSNAVHTQTHEEFGDVYLHFCVKWPDAVASKQGKRLRKFADVLEKMLADSKETSAPTSASEPDPDNVAHSHATITVKVKL